MGKDMKTDNGIKWTDQQAHVIDTRHGNLLVSAAVSYTHLTLPTKLEV